MKTTKHIKTLAAKLAEKDAKRCSYGMSVDCFAEILTEIKNAMLKGRFYVGVDSVSRSGMSRTLRLAYIKDNRLCGIRHPLVLGLAGCSPSGRISGCGMDMCFAAQYNLFIALHKSYKQAHYQKRMPTYGRL